MVKDDRYTAVQSVYKDGKIQKFRDIFKYLPKSVLARDLNLNYRSFVSKVNAPGRFTVSDIARMEEFIGISGSQLFDIILADAVVKKKKG